MLTIGTVGTSRIAGELALAAAAVGGVSVRTAFSRDQGRAEDFAREHNIAKAVSTPRELWDDSGLDAVYIATPNSTHERWVCDALDAGKHVLVEKPAVSRSASFVALAQWASAHDLVLMEAMRSVYEPGFDLIEEWLSVIGPVRHVSFALCQRSSRYDKVLAGEKPAIFDPELGGGALRDLGVYPIAALIRLFGEPSDAIGRTFSLPTGADGVGTALLTYPEFIAEVTYSKITASRRPSEIQGERGRVLIDQIDQPREIVLAASGRPPVRRIVDLPPSDLRPVLRRFRDLVGGDRDAGRDQRATAATLAVVEQVARSWVDVVEHFAHRGRA
ncbi:Gfo/Idh/MocA family protein [Microbacterium sp. H83]|uniref:Gfo/Idh/MocA family protein n=1 Tax=Microbacterium sp. H83 TaxID=1827324 RepID=UPI0007F384D4|nr:Gfo/Idh/MocA family oxidoreductase [Microbacterium sp. H83]OAN40927.1 hypothetical protein A4X16_01995 [Microbacterium sp. H83]